MAPTRMKLRVRQRDAAAAPAGGALLEEDAEGPRQSRRSSRRKANKKGPAPSSSAPSASPPTTSSGGARPAVAAEASPDSKCPICLDRFNNLAYLDHCLHRFCFPCIQEWSHNKAECPLCKQPFASILHSVRAEDDFKEYTLQPPPPPPPRAAASQLTASTFLTTVAAMTSDGSTQHHLRLMLRRHLVATDQEAVRRRRRREQAASGRRSGDRMGEWEFFMHSPPLPVSPYHLNMSEIIMGDMGVEQAEEEERRLDFGEPPGAAAPPTRASRRLMCRLAVRQRLQREGGVAQMRGAELMAFRKALYQCGVRVRGVTGNQGRQRSVTAEAFRRSSAHLNRLHAWLRRELAVLLGSRSSLADVVQRAVMARVRRSGLEDPDTIEEELRPFLLGRTAHFVHEMVSFARSSLRMEVYDQQAVYELPPSALELDRLSTSSDGSSVIAISEGEEEEAEEERGGRSDGAAGGSHDDVIATGSSLSLSGWDDETPGPSYTSAEPPPPFSPAPQEPANQERGEEEECLIVGYKKPMAERTPELVQLSSDSEEEEGEKKKKEEEVTSGAAEKAPPPPPPSCLPIIPASTSGAFRAEAEELRERDPRRWRSGSWSESSGGSRLSVCSLSPATPERRRQDRRKKKKKRGRDRSGECLRRSGTFCNPNRSIFPPMMSRRSPSPLRSSADSASSPPRSPRDSSWEFRLSQVSPLSSSVSSPCRSFSPLYSSPPESPPTPSYSPKRPHHVDKPGGKRKYKSRHLNSGAKDPPWRPERRRRGERERKKREKPRRRENGSLRTGSRRSREERSPSVEIIYEGTLPSGAEQPSGPKRRRRRHRRTQLTSSPVIITLDSDSSHDDANKKTNSASSSPLSSQQTIDFSDLPSLPLAPSAGGGGTMDADIGDLPADILDRGSDGSECEAVGPSRAKNRRDNSFVDVTNVEETVSLPDTSDDQQTAEPVAAAEPKAPSGGQREAAAVGEREGSGPGHRRDPEPSSSDRCLLESILNDLNQLAPPRRELALNPDYRFPPEKRRRTLQESSAEAGRWPGGGTCSGPAPPISCQQNQDYSSRTSSVPSPPPVERAEGREVPPLLRRTSPVGSYHRNTPPPLKHKDDTQQGAAFPRDVRPRHHDCDPTGRSSPVLLGLNNHAIPPISTLKNHLHHLYPSPAGFPAYPHSSGSDYFPGLGFGSFPPTESHPSRGRLKLSSAAELSPVNSSHSSDLRPAPRSSACGGDGGSALSPIRRGAPPSWSLFSGPDSNGAAAFLADKLHGSSCSARPAGGAPPETPDPVARFSDPAHSALPSSPRQRPGGFLSSNTTFTSQCHPDPFHLYGSESAPQNHRDVSSTPQPFPGSHAHLHPSEPVPPPQNQNHLDSLNSHPKSSHRNFEQNPDNQPCDPQRGSERSALNTSETLKD
ncbi:uncharacterized protein V3H82_013211 isoform 2-T2 [Fundulus diaphanus]